MRTKGLDGEKYFMVLIDDYKRMTVFCFLKKIYKEMVEIETDLKIKCLRSENGGEFTLK
jgi:hypothetical protein